MEPFLLERIVAMLQKYYRLLSGWFLVLVFHLSRLMEEFKYIKVRQINIIEFKDTTVNLASHYEQLVDISLTCN